MLVIESKWKRNAKSSFNFGILIWEKRDSHPHFLQLRPNDQISWTVMGPKRCIGSRSNTGSLNKCPEMSVVKKNKKRCGPCSAVDIYDPCIRCFGRTCNANEERAENCAQTDYIVYLALFSDKSLKVGVSVKHRILTRWVEQGADFGMILTDVKGGKKARNIENLLSKSTILKKSVHPSRKLKGILNQISDNEAHRRIEEFMKILDEFSFDLHLGKLTNLSEYYNLSEMQAKPMQWLKPKSKVEGKQLLGKVVGMKGSLLVTRIKHAYTIANIQQLVGHTIDCEKEIETVTQSGLLDYF